jgi:putative phosphoserine phosphatase/1-acylglycerol-3-phosphate O-acyltransferase
MATVAELQAAIESAPRGPQVGAFFDYDGTIIDGGSLRELDLQAWEGRDEQELEALGERVFRRDIAGHLHHEAWRLAQAHHRAGHTVVLCSAASRFEVEPMARELAAHHALCTPVETREGKLTGRLGGPPLWGVAKARAVEALADEHDLELTESFAYSNGDKDLPLLEACGHAVAVDPDSRLRSDARTRGWPVLECSARGRPDPVSVVRTAGFYGAMATALGAGIGLGVLNRSRSTVLEIAAGVGSDVGLSVAGVKVEVTSGQEHLWSARPCVFVINHQSKLDVMIVSKLLRTAFTGVAKKEAARIPGFGQLFWAVGVAFVDRGDVAKARRALAPAIAKLREEGISLAIAPEGTRSVTPRLGQFKKGAFHIAMQAEVPMVPIVIRNAGEAMWRDSQTLRATTVEVAVLPPVDTSDWSVSTIDDHVAEVHGMFQETLANWPSASRGRVLEPAR